MEGRVGGLAWRGLFGVMATSSSSSDEIRLMTWLLRLEEPMLAGDVAAVVRG